MVFPRMIKGGSRAGTGDLSQSGESWISEKIGNDAVKVNRATQHAMLRAV